MFIDNQRHGTGTFNVEGAEGCDNSKDGGDCGCVMIFLSQVRAGSKVDSRVFLCVYEHIQKWFLSMVYTGVEEEYLDIIDEAITRFIEKGRDFRGNSVGEFYNYMRTIIRNLIADQARIASRIRNGEINGEVRDTRAHTAREVELNQEYEALYSCIDTLAPTLKSIVYEILAGRKKKNIAEDFGISPSLLSQNIKKAFQFLRNCLSGKGYSADLAC